MNGKWVMYVGAAAVVVILCILFRFPTKVIDKIKGNMIDGHEYVDLGLPSGTLWATCNVGANTPVEYGDYFAWGETKPKTDYRWETYKWIKGREDFITKYCVDRGHGIVDNFTTLLAEDDAATVNWSAEWRMPTQEEQEELIGGCNWEWTDDFNGSGVTGRIGISKTNGNTIFLPAAGVRVYAENNVAGEYGDYWSSSLNESISIPAYSLNFCSDNIDWYLYNRIEGHSVRAVVNK